MNAARNQSQRGLFILVTTAIAIIFGGVAGPELLAKRAERASHAKLKKEDKLKGHSVPATTATTVLPIPKF